MGIVYLLHFDPPYKHARHYMGFTSYNDMKRRFHAHATGRGARLTEVAVAAGCRLILACTWPGDRRLERRLKTFGHARLLCPLCIAADRKAARAAARKS